MRICIAGGGGGASNAANVIMIIRRTRVSLLFSVLPRSTVRMAPPQNIYLIYRIPSR